MSDETNPTCIMHAINKRLWIIRQGCQVTVGVEEQQVVLLRVAVLIVDLLSDQKQDRARFERGGGSKPVVTLHALDQYVVVCYDDRVQPSSHCGMSNIFMSACAVRVTGVHM